MKRLLPNIITGLRLCMLPVFASCVLEGAGAWATGLLIAIALSDALDGYLARRWNAESRLGALLDPSADKLTQITALILLSLTGHAVFTPVPPLLVSIILARDLLLAYGAYRIRARAGHVAIKPRWEGKLSTALVFVLLLASCAGAAPWIVNGLAIAAAPFAVAAGARYTIDGWKQRSP